MLLKRRKREKQQFIIEKTPKYKTQEKTNKKTEQVNTQKRIRNKK